MSSKRNAKNSFNYSGDDRNEALEEMENKLKKNQEAKTNSSGNKFKIFTFVSALAVAILIAKSPLFRLNLDKPLKANYIELTWFLFIC